MTKAKASYGLAARPRSYPTAEECAAEFGVSVSTWNRWVRDGVVPPAVPTSPADMPRWRWADVDDWMANPIGRPLIRSRYAGSTVAVADSAEDSGVDPFVAAAGNLYAPTPRKRRG